MLFKVEIRIPMPIYHKSFIIVLLCKTLLIAQSLSLDQIQINLLTNPPNTGDPNLREATILDLDNILKHDSSRTSPDVCDFYNFMMAKVSSELQDTVTSGITIWMMYNHGMVIKSPQVVFAFDLVDGYSGWTQQLPSELITEIDVLFISHWHGDHYDYSIANTVIVNGGDVVVPSEDTYITGSIPMAPGDSIMISGLQIKAHYGLHSTALRIYEVTTTTGFKILHTGDNQTSDVLPIVENIDVLLLNAWVNESGSTSAVIGMRNCINALNPAVMIPGHIQELAHAYNPGNPTSRVPYEWAYEVDDVSLNSDVEVMAWGERYFLSEVVISISDQKSDLELPRHFTLYQNYPNPFNPNTTIHYELPQRSDVRITIYDLLGRKVTTLVSEIQDAGYKSARWDASNDKGQPVSAGVYFYQIKVYDPIAIGAGELVKTKKMEVIK